MNRLEKLLDALAEMEGYSLSIDGEMDECGTYGKFLERSDVEELIRKHTEGMALVPVEPTKHQHNAAYGVLGSPLVKDKKSLVDGIYKAMIEAGGEQ